MPFAVQINDIMRKEDRTWNIRSLNTTFLTFMKKLEDEVSRLFFMAATLTRGIWQLAAMSCATPEHLV